MKRISIILLTLMLTVLPLWMTSVWAVSPVVQAADAFGVYPEGTYTTSAYDGTYYLDSENGFPKQANVAYVELKPISGMRFVWQNCSEGTDVQIQVMPDGMSAYIGQNGTVDRFDFRILVYSISTGELMGYDISRSSICQISSNRSPVYSF